MKTALDNEAAVIAGAARALTTNSDYDSLVEMAGEAQCVLIGEASHGTHEFYAIRTALTRRLIEEKGFRAVALEADGPDSFRVHRFVTGRSDDKRASEALNDFRRFPSWMWRNTVVVDFIEWLRQWNAHNKDNLVGFYGLDLYSMHTSIEAVLNYLDKIGRGAPGPSALCLFRSFWRRSAALWARHCRRQSGAMRRRCRSTANGIATKIRRIHPARRTHWCG